MSVYLYNVLFSLSGSDFSVGRFKPYSTAIGSPTIANQSCAWFQYLLAGAPNGLGDYYQQLTSALTPSQWGNPQPDTNSLQLNPGDYLVIRVASADSSVANYQTRVTGVFGRGTGQNLAAGAGDLQSPLVMSTPAVVSVLPRTVVDLDGSTPANWSGPILADGSWTMWLGMAHVAPGNAANDYNLNVGASVYVNSNPPSAGNLFTFGHDVRMHVGGSMRIAAA
jgi:hypothetical protein